MYILFVLMASLLPITSIAMEKEIETKKEIELPSLEIGNVLTNSVDYTAALEEAKQLFPHDLLEKLVVGKNTAENDQINDEEVKDFINLLRVQTLLENHKEALASHDFTSFKENNYDFLKKGLNQSPTDLPQLTLKKSTDAEGNIELIKKLLNSHEDTIDISKLKPGSLRDTIKSLIGRHRKKKILLNALGGHLLQK